jgi:hypothetical protein
MAEIDSEAAVSSERYREYASVFISLHKSSERAILVRLHHFVNTHLTVLAMCFARQR